MAEAATIPRKFAKECGFAAMGCMPKSTAPVTWAETHLNGVQVGARLAAAQGIHLAVEANHRKAPTRLVQVCDLRARTPNLACVLW